MNREDEFVGAIGAPIILLDLFLCNSERFSRLADRLDFKRAANMIDSDPSRTMVGGQRFWQTGGVKAIKRRCEALQAVEDAILSQCLDPPQAVATHPEGYEFRQRFA